MVGGVGGAAGVGGMPAGFGSISNNPGMGKMPGASNGIGGGGSFGDMLKDMIINKPTASQSEADRLAADFAAGKDIDPQNLAIATAKAGIEVQMSTRTISQAVQAVRTLMQMQI